MPDQRFSGHARRIRFPTFFLFEYFFDKRITARGLPGLAPGCTDSAEKKTSTCSSSDAAAFYKEQKMEVAIVGAGKLGYKVAEALSNGDYSVTIIDRKEALLDKIAQHLDVMTINEDARRMSVLQDIGIEHFDYLLTATSNDEMNIVIAAMAKKLGCRHVIARVRDPEHMNQIDLLRETFNLDVIVNPDLAITEEIYKYLAEKYTLQNGIFTTGKVSMIEFEAKNYARLIGCSITDIRSIFPDFLVLALSRNGKVIIPHGNDTIEQCDLLYMLGEQEKICKLHKKVNKKRSNILRKVMIIGGGKTGYYLSQKLADFGAAVKLVEQDLARCQYLATQLENVMILHVDGTDITTLEDENMDGMDAFVTATGYDEENLLLALTAKRKGIPDVIAKVSHENYVDLIEEMGVDMVLNPLDITASNILREIQGASRIITSVLIQGQAELIEVRAQSGMNLIGKPISELPLPNSILIAAIDRGGQLIIPDGDTKIKRNDHVIMLSLLSSISSLEKLLKPKR